jgi:DNA polymerase-3 subunit delta
MASKASQFDSDHWASSLWPVTGLFGDEAFFLTRLSDAWRHHGRHQGFGERVVLDQTDSDVAARLNAEHEALSLFADYTLVELRLARPVLDAALRDALLRYISAPVADKRLLVTGPKPGKGELKSDWYQALDRNNHIIEATAVPSYQFADWLNRELQQHNLRLDDDASQAVLQHTEGNMLAAGQVIERLKLVQPDLLSGDQISLEHVVEVLTQSARYTVYDLIDCALKADLKSVNRIADLLRAEGVDAMSTLFAIHRELDILLQIRHRMDQGEAVNQAIAGLRIWRSREGLTRACVNRLSLTTLRKLLTLCNETDRTIKGGSHEPAWFILKDILFGLAGQPINR